jgi:hypothetical protein
MNYEPCKGCEVLQTQLNIANENNKELTQMLLNLLNPKVVEVPAVAVNPIKQNLSTFSKRREALEAEDRNKARVELNSKFIAKVDDVVPTDKTKTAGETNVEELEKQLGVS